MTTALQRCTVAELNALLMKTTDCQLIDVREYSEFAAARIAGARLVPLATLAQNVATIDRNQCAYLLCRSGARAAQAAAKLSQLGFQDLVIVDGGMQAWDAAGFPLEKSASQVWSLERQVRFTAGLFVATGILLSLFVHPWFIAIAGLIGAGLMFSAVTDTCGMGMMLAKMPWNQAPKIVPQEMNANG